MVNSVVGETLRALRKKAHFTQQEAADKLGLKNKSTLASWECGKAEPDTLTFLSLCVTYGVAEAAALITALNLQDTIQYDFAAIGCEAAQEQQLTDKKPYTFCPYCGEKLD